MSKVKKNKSSNDAYMLCMLLSIVSILAVILKDYFFKIGNIDMTYSSLVLPFILFISNYITKKYNVKTSLQSILISSLMIVTFLILIKDLTNQPIVILDLVGNFLSYFISLVIHLFIYYYILTNFKENALLIYFNYIFSMLMHQFIYLLFLYQLVSTSVFWNNYFISLVIQSIISIFLVVIDSKIKRGEEKIKKIKKKTS